ncbi:MAG: hypothetical protein GC204_10815 [Chloroflexi bacterium]|nr:hypothetical protein [Chloroflexota bacterium]
MMNQSEVEAFVEQLENVQREENFGYIFYFVGDDHLVPFVSIAAFDNDYDRVSNLDRDGVFRINIGVSRETFNTLVGRTQAEIDYTSLNVFLPHPEYAKQHFVCILNPSGANEETTKKLMVEAHDIAAARLERRASK